MSQYKIRIDSEDSITLLYFSGPEILIEEFMKNHLPKKLKSPYTTDCLEISITNIFIDRCFFLDKRESLIQDFSNHSKQQLKNYDYVSFSKI